MYTSSIEPGCSSFFTVVGSLLFVMLCLDLLFNATTCFSWRIVYPVRSGKTESGHAFGHTTCLFHHHYPFLRGLLSGSAHHFPFYLGKDFAGVDIGFSFFSFCDPI